MSESTRNLSGLDFVGGDPSLDFANTINSRFAPEHDYLRTVEDLLIWAEAAGVLMSDDHKAVLPLTTGTARAEDLAVAAVHRLREAIYRTFSAIAAGAPPPQREVGLVLRAYGRAVGRAALDAHGRGFGLRWIPISAETAVLDPIAYAAGQLLLAPDRPPIKECPGCGWLFLDHSRNASRRWCDMRTCGSRDKMRRYYRSRRAGGAPPPAITPSES
jgi:predicted RNA-binding Zn ribbon-like protein